ncbi:NAD(P)/FAD-dependent oxidoreductase [Magnetospirillum sp. SS-4]|uniref:dihydrolipoyl dehydrogenase family protein n=1 Tax=Magnetospirillum sp. SS-4 TaxID=2681465 RepID=UPI00137ECFAB|nr:FAD-dependent oxidoreductase [Magnetospirillum sp. SS-4]CAA7627603.1 FAD-dependent pyridine nucleotide-disulfide oxidoreductase [Magnetospirillum sp. SS-4]
MADATYDLCIIGAGSAGLSIAAGAAQMGARTVLIEGERMGGDCLNTGCVPSKSLLAAAHAAHAARHAGAFGVTAGDVAVDFKAVHDHVHSVIAAIAPHDSEERFRGLGCTVIKAHGRFVDPATLEAGGTRIKARRFVVATGSRAMAPPIPGLDQVPCLTNETLFELTALPAHLVVIGAGPIGCEMAQAFRRLGADVTILDKGAMLPRDDPEAVAVVRDAYAAEGIALAEKVDIERIEAIPGGVAVVLSGGRRVEGSHLLVAAGRRPNVEDLGLDAAGVIVTPKGIQVDERLRTSNAKVFAAGDVAGGPQFTHWAGYHAGIILRNALFRLPTKVDMRALPWVTYTEPELAQVGLTEADSRARLGGSIRVLKVPFADNDRARAERRTEGFAKAITDAKGRILGATIVGPHAGELIQTWGLAISSGLKIGAVAGMIAPYPTLGEINKRAAGSFYTPTLFSRRTRWLVRLLGCFG